MLTSLVGARSSSTRPTGGTRPLQLQNRMSRKNAAKSGMYGSRRRPGDAQPEVAQELVEPLEHVLGAPRDELRAADHQDRHDEDDRHDDPHRQDRRADARVEDDELRRPAAASSPRAPRRRAAPGTRACPRCSRPGRRRRRPGAPSLGNGGTRISATMLKTMTAPMIRNQREDSPRPDFGLRRWGLGDLRGHDLLARHACSTHRSAASTPRSDPPGRSGSDRLIE